MISPDFNEHTQKQLQARLFYRCRAGNILHELNSLTNDTTRNRTKTVHIWGPRENTTCLQESVTYNAQRQNWTCDICVPNRKTARHPKRDRTHTLAHKKETGGHETINRGQLEPIAPKQEVRGKTILLPKTKPPNLTATYLKLNLKRNPT